MISELPSDHESLGAFPTNEEEQLAVLLSCFNTPIKALTFLALAQSTSPIMVGEIIDKVNALSSSTTMGRLDANVVPALIIKNFARYGLAVHDSPGGSYNREAEVTLNDSLQEKGLLVAQLALWLEGTYGFSLYHLLGRSGSNSGEVSNSAPIIRAQVLEYLHQHAKDNGVRIVDIENSTGRTGGTVGTVVSELAEKDLLELVSIHTQTGETQIAYQLTSKQFNRDDFSSRTDLAKEVLKICRFLIQQGEAITQRTVYDFLPDTFLSRWKSEHVGRASLWAVFAELVNEDYLSKGILEGAKQSDVKSSPMGELLVEEYIAKLRALLQNDSKTMRELSAVDLDERVKQQAIEAYFPYSMRRLKQVTRENYDWIKQIVKTNDEPMTLADIALSTRLTKQGVRKHIEQAVLEGEVLVEKVRGVNYYRWAS